MAKRMLINAFSMNCVSHIQQGQWVRDDTRQLEYNRLERWVELAQILEKGCFDALFLADVMGLYDTYHAGPETSIEEGMQVPANDPALLVSATAHVTEHLGLGLHLRPADVHIGSFDPGPHRVERRNIVPVQRRR